MLRTIVTRMIDLRLNHIYKVVLQDDETLEDMVFYGTQRGFLVFYNEHTFVAYHMRRSSIKRTIHQSKPKE